MSDDTKSKSNPPAASGDGEKPVEGESDQSVTKLERSPLSAPPKDAVTETPGKDDDEKAAAKDKDEDDKPAVAKSVPPKAKTVEVEDDPTGAQSPVAKSKSRAGDEKTSPGVRQQEAAKAKPKSPYDDEAKAKKPAAKKTGGGGGGRVPPKPTGGDGDGRRRRGALESGGILVLFGVFLVLANLALRSSVFRIDATKDERFSVSKKGTGHLLSTLTKPLKITVYHPKGFATVDAFIRDLHDLLDEYKRLGAGKVDYEFENCDELEGEKKTKCEAKAQEAGLHKELLGEARGTDKGATVGEGFLGIELTYGGEKALIAPPELNWQHAEGLEFLISTKIREIRDKEEKISHRIGFLQGHKEHGFQELSQLFGRYFPYYKLEAVDLNKGEKEVDQGLDGLFVTQPEEEIPPKELHRIDQFLMRGKAVAVIANPLHIKENDTSMNTSFNGMGVDKLLSGYGIDFKNELLFDKQQYWTPVLMGPNGLGIQLDPYPFVLVADSSNPSKTFDNAFAPFFRLEAIAVPFPLEMTFDKARAGGDAVKTNYVLKTTPNIITIQGQTVSLNPLRDRLLQGATGQTVQNREKGKEALLGIDLEGPIKSAFPGGGEGVEGVPATAAGNARLFVLSSGYYFGNPFRDAGKSPFGGMMPGMDPNMGADEDLMRYAQIYDRDQRARITSYLVAWHTCDWMTGETDLLAVGAKLLQEPELTYPGNPAPTPAADEKPDSDSYKKKKQQWADEIRSTQRWTQYTCMFGGALLLLVIGGVRLYQRNSTRESVKL